MRGRSGFFRSKTNVCPDPKPLAKSSVAGSGAAGRAVASSPDFDDVAYAVADRLLSNGREVLTLLTGADEPNLDGFLERIHEGYPGVELDVQPGGQPHYPLLLSAE